MAEEVKVDIEKVREEVGRSPGLPQDTYEAANHIDNALQIYGVPGFVVAGALSFGEQTDAKFKNRVRYTIQEVKTLIEKFHGQKDLGHIEDGA